MQYWASPVNRGCRIVAHERRWRVRAPSVTLLIKRLFFGVSSAVE
jgi:hypothetical protein